jgi:hypothetical protein
MKIEHRCDPAGNDTHVYLGCNEHVFVHCGSDVELSVCVSTPPWAGELVMEGPLNTNKRRRSVTKDGWLKEKRKGG